MPFSLSQKEAPMDLKIKDVADLLNISESTVRRWVSDGKIPSYYINHQFRFSRMEIEKWMMEHASSPFSDQPKSEAAKKATTKSGPKQYSLYRAIHNGDVFHDIAGDTKEEIIRNTMKVLAKKLNLDAEVITDLLLDRERLMPTALNNGVGVPHTRESLTHIHKDIVAIVFPKKSIAYGALDNLPVHAMFFLFACEDKRHLHLLAKIAHLSGKGETLQLLRSQPTKNDLLLFIKDWESSIQFSPAE